MSIVIEVTFPFGYVHATPWGTHVNEGAVEWPPSPWRLLRALVATWKTRYPDLSPGQVVSALTALAASPAVRLANRVECSIRTYLPAEDHRNGADKPDTDLVVDSFAAVAPGTGVSYRWTTELDQHSREILTLLVEGLPYLGRAESVCEATVHFEDESGGWLEPLPDEFGEGTRVLVPTLPFDLDALCIRIQDMRRGRRLVPPGATWIRYQVAPPMTTSTSGPRRVPARAKSRAVRLALSGPRPLAVRHTLVVAEACRAAAMSKYGELFDQGTSELLAGKDAEGVPLKGNRHAHWCPLDLDGDGLLDTVLVWSTDGFGPRELTALGEIRELRFHAGDGLRGVVLDAALEIAVPADALAKGGIDRLLEPSERWRSVSPFLPQRHRRRASVDDWLADCVGRELAARGIEAEFELRRDRTTSWGSFRRHRRGERLAQARPGYGFTLEFDRPVSGPIAIGSLSHFGMGRFERC